MSREKSIVNLILVNENLRKVGELDHKSRLLHQIPLNSIESLSIFMCTDVFRFLKEFPIVQNIIFLNMSYISI